MTIRTLTLATVAAAAFAAAAPRAEASLIIQAKGGSTGDVVAFEQHFMNLTSFAGDTNKGASTVLFKQLNSSGTGPGTELIGTDGNGQADVVCQTNCNPLSGGGFNGSMLTGLEIQMVAPIAATTFIGNLDFGIGTAEIVAQDQFGNAFDMTLTKGSNFFRIDALAGSGEVITDIKIFENAPSGPPNNTFGWNDLKQPRIVACTIGVDCLQSATAPEPASIALLGVGLLGLGFVANRKRS